MGIISAINTDNGDLLMLEGLDITSSGGSGGDIPSGSITTVKLANGAVTEVKLGNGAVTKDKIADNAITMDKISSSVLPISNYIPSGTVFTIASSGGDFTTLANAYSFLQKKWSDDTVTLKLEAQSFSFGSPTLTFDTSTFNIPHLIIEGQEGTVLTSSVPNNYYLYVTGSGRITFKNIKFNVLRLIIQLATYVSTSQCLFTNQNGFAVLTSKNSTYVSEFDEFEDIDGAPYQTQTNARTWIRGQKTTNCNAQATATRNGIITIEAAGSLNNDNYTPALNTLGNSGGYITKL